MRERRREEGREGWRKESRTILITHPEFGEKEYFHL